jgi:AcrR family transcriptional regulator
MKSQHKTVEPNQSTSERILDAAELIFARLGFSAASTRNIAKEAAANIGLITYYFGSKEGLFEAVIARRAEELTRYISQSIEKDSTSTQSLIQFLSKTARFLVAEHTPFLVIIVRESLGTEPSDLAGVIATQLVPHRNRLAEVLEVGTRDGTFQQVDPIAYYTMTLGMYAALAGWPSMGPVHSETAVRHMIDLLVRGILHDSAVSTPERPEPRVREASRTPRIQQNDSFDIGTVD